MSVYKINLKFVILVRKINSDPTFSYEELEKDEKYFDFLLCLLIITFYFIDSFFFLRFIHFFSLALGSFPVFHLLWKRTLPSCVTIFAFFLGYTETTRLTIPQVFNCLFARICFLQLNKRIAKVQNFKIL